MNYTNIDTSWLPRVYTTFPS